MISGQNLGIVHGESQFQESEGYADFFNTLK